MRGTGGSKERGRGESKFAEKRKKRKTVFSVTPAAGPIDSAWINFTLLLLLVSLRYSIPPQSLPDYVHVIVERYVKMMHSKCGNGSERIPPH